MPVFQYQAVHRENQEHHEEGTIVADDKLQAWDKLTRRNLINIKLKKLQGINAFLKKIMAS